MKILSLFDGISCGQVAINRLGIKNYKYYSSEIDKYTIKITQNNYPKTIQIGSVTEIKTQDYKNIDILFGGSPCQNLSFAGNQNGLVTKGNIEVLSLEHYLELKKQKFTFSGESYLFWEYVRVLRGVKPKRFLLENVRMSKKWKAVLSEAIGFEPIEIDSTLVSAQDRKRLYWYGELQDNGEYKQIEVSQPRDRKILLKDIIEHGEVEDIYYKEKITSANIQPLPYRQRIDSFSTFNQDNMFCGLEDKVPCLTAGDGSIRPKLHNRLFTALECERAQTLDDNYTECEGVSVRQRKKAIGNSWTPEVIVHILTHR